MVIPLKVIDIYYVYKIVLYILHSIWTEKYLNYVKNKNRFTST